MVQELEQGERREWSDDGGSITLIRLPPRLAVIQPRGRVGEGAAEFWQQHNDWLLYGGNDGLLLFFDAGELGFVGASFISAGSTMTTDARPRMAEFHVLVANVMIEMIAKTINMSMGGFMTLHRKREPFEDALQRALELQRLA